ncbi:hypothetical protein DGMP_37270 [Desulfomarina profundi]|uniref:J domain-containing protein n=1 Tax=Desulfomarina profundi TaxID=2772557 RepID=A0A8D5JIT8_9BACT|nr:DnaJ domain-containing protein [Desulfomarina profundi]BCL63034.1 hypothetical protein DGMP_37270 [Desulfomarina profundi]
MKNYYEILQVTATSTEDEIRRNYRRLAMRYHPDRNPDSPEAEEKFKEIAEAYGVLTDPVKRQQYDRMKASGNGATGFTYSQEDILRDLFKDPRFQQMFNGLLREFQRSGFRSSSHFIKNSFFRGKGGIFLGGIFFVGSMAGPLLSRTAKKSIGNNSSLLKSLTSTLGSLLGGHGRQEDRKEETKQLPDYDTTYHTPLSADELKRGKTIQVVVYGNRGEQTLKVKIPPNSRNGQKLRIKGKGRPGPYGRGDLYLNLVEQSSGQS